MINVKINVKFNNFIFKKLRESMKKYINFCENYYFNIFFKTKISVNLTFLMFFLFLLQQKSYKSYLFSTYYQ